MRLEVELALAAEPAAEQRDDDAHVRLGDLERVATPERAMNGTCVDDQTVTWSPCHSATIARGSIGTACDMSAT